MAAAYDFLLDENGDLLFQNGDLVIGESDKQHIADTINAAPGWWKQFPANGVGIGAYYKSRVNTQALVNKIRQELEKDGYTVLNPTVKFINDKLLVNPDAYRI